ncbi:hypothetical protein Rhe02_20670 [Rhizocola hellebori]|uniref:Peptidase C-terminal archaeal/bacterial domain-containing protein n=1 Tax=Rhizocola hellebori TaxID=1392758 RepID=A0A8J3VEY0_9ACTN|nr:hypothetical protein [Rhizocola hellebori]GIH04000.1 hypothetical protein Rhe02_20670 [Rhizocola hellebori]
MLPNRFTSRAIAALTALFIGAAGGAAATGIPAIGAPGGSGVGNPTQPGVVPTAAVPAGVKAAQPVRPSGQGITAATLPASTRIARAGIDAACDTRVKGNFSYLDQNAVWHNLMNMQVQVWDVDPETGDDLLAAAVTDYFGNYNICFDSASETAPDTGTADVRVRFVSEVSQWRVGSDAGPYMFQTGTIDDVKPGAVLDMGSLTTGAPGLHRALHAYDIVDFTWLWIPKPVNGCFDPKDAVCRQMRIRWTEDSVDGPYYAADTNTVRLAATDPDTPMAVTRELANSLMDDVYNDAMPATPNCAPHTVTIATSTGCAWVEGFAHWFTATMYNDPFVRLPGGTSLSLEGQRWGDGWGETDASELRVAGALLDITDTGNETLWDRAGEGWSNIWYTFTHHVSNTFAEFWAHRATDEFNVAETGAMACLYQNAIDYQFRDPLTDYTTLARPPAVPSHNFQYRTTSVYWSAVALRPAAGADHDLYLFDDRAQTASLGGSWFGGSTVDIVAVDTNRRPMGDYYPQVRLWGGAADYQIQLAQGPAVLNPGNSNILAMNASSIVQVMDTSLSAGVPVTLRVTPSNIGQNPELFLFGSDPADPNTFVRSRGQALASSTAGGPGAAETITFTPPRSGWYGVVVINAAGAGNYTMTRI